TSLTPADTADTSTKRRSVCWLISEAIVVLPVPGGPHNRIVSGCWPSTICRNGDPGSTRCSLPTSSSRLVGRIRTARGSRAPGESDKRAEPAGVCGTSNRPSSVILRSYRRPCFSPLHRFGCGVDSGFFTLLDGDRPRSAGQRIEAPSRLGERDHVADGVRARQKSTNTVPAECDSAV